MDCTFKTDEGKFNYRVGALIRDGNRILMASMKYQIQVMCVA